MVLVLKPALIATEVLSNSSSNFIEGEAIIRSLLNRTSKLESAIGRRFHEHLHERLNSRRNIAVISLAMYLCNHEDLSKTSLASYPLKLQSKSAVHTTGTQMIKRLFGESYETEIFSENSEEIVSSQLSFSEEMKKEIQTT